ncbi:hypothetical protein ACFY2M_44800 [Streptomyces sp. NPDC001276]|uniref:hypothetical protein n=1 Tax=Streptomyces sp. NPDC001276 TaxID=3364555 RepID=UPI00367FF602
MTPCAATAPGAARLLSRSGPTTPPAAFAGITWPKLTGRSAIAAAGVDQAVKAAAHVHVAGRHSVGGHDHARADANGR